MKLNPQTVTLKNWQANSLLMITAIIWGTGFVAQRLGMDAIGPMLFNGLRFALGAIFLLPFTIYSSNFSHLKQGLTGGIALGILLFCGSVLQQVGIMYTSIANAGFITGFYVIFVPLLGILLGHRLPRGTWIGAILAVVGLYFLSVTATFSVSYGDLLQLAGAFFWAAHVLAIARYTQHTSPIALAFMQFVICSLLSLLVALFIEEWNVAAMVKAGPAVLYSGLVAVGVGYTLQVVGQKSAPAAHAAIILSLEAVFAALAGWLLLNEVLTLRQFFGAGLMLAGLLIAQLLPLYTSSSAKAT